jgi:hypothetical protein
MKFIKKPLLIYLFLTIVADALFYGLSDPAGVGTVLLMVGFVLAVITIYWLSLGFAALLGLYSKTLRRQRQRLARAFTVGGAVLVALQSMGQLSLHDVAVLLPLVALAYFYVSYHRPNRSGA